MKKIEHKKINKELKDALIKLVEDRFGDFETKREGNSKKISLRSRCKEQRV